MKEYIPNINFKKICAEIEKKIEEKKIKREKEKIRSESELIESSFNITRKTRDNIFELSKVLNIKVDKVVEEGIKLLLLKNGVS